MSVDKNTNQPGSDGSFEEIDNLPKNVKDLATLIAGPLLKSLQAAAGKAPEQASQTQKEAKQPLSSKNK